MCKQRVLITAEPKTGTVQCKDGLRSGDLVLLIPRSFRKIEKNNYEFQKILKNSQM